MYMVLNWLLPLRSALQRFWDPTRFKSGRTDSERHSNRPQDTEPVDVDMVTKAINSTWFWAYSLMRFSLQCCIDSLYWWGEACPCHPKPVISRNTRYKDNLAVLRPLKGLLTMWTHCPMSGKRAPELVAGFLEQVLREISEMELLELFQSVGPVIYSDDLNSVLSDWEAGQFYIAAELRIKLR